MLCWYSAQTRSTLHRSLDSAFHTFVKHLSQHWDQWSTFHISVLSISFQCDVVHKILLWWSYLLLWTKYLNQYVCTRNAPPSVLKAIEYSFSKPIPLNYIFFFKRTPRGVTEPCHWIWLSILNTDYISISVKCTLLRNFFSDCRPVINTSLVA